MSNIISDWKNGLVLLTQIVLERLLAIDMNKTGFTPDECHTGLRISNMIDIFDIDAEQLEYF